MAVTPPDEDLDCLSVAQGIKGHKSVCRGVCEWFGVVVLGLNFWGLILNQLVQFSCWMWLF